MINSPETENNNGLLDAVSVKEAPRFLPRRNGKNVSARTVWRWMDKGTRGVRLESSMIGGRRVVTLSQLRDFNRRLNDAIGSSAIEYAARVAAARERIRREHGI